MGYLWSILSKHLIDIYSKKLDHFQQKIIVITICKIV